MINEGTQLINTTEADASLRKRHSFVHERVRAIEQDPVSVAF